MSAIDSQINASPQQHDDDPFKEVKIDNMAEKQAHEMDDEDEFGEEFNEGDGDAGIDGGEDEEDVEEEDEEAGENEEEEDVEVGDEEFQRGDSDKKRKRKLSEKKSKKSSRKKLSRYNFFNEEAEVADSDEDDEEYDVPDKEEILDKDHLEAIARVDKRHIENRDNLKRSAEEIVADIERRHQYQEQFKQQFEDNKGFLGQQATPVAQQALLPSFKDPKLFKIKCKPSYEQLAIRAIMLKTIDLHNTQQDFYKIKSAFCGTSKGYIYVEAISEAFAKEVLNGLKMIYLNSFQQVPIPDMTSVLSVTISKKPLKPGDYVRIKRGPLKGDLARIINLFDGETKALIQAVPRIVYNSEENSLNLDGSTGKKKVILSANNPKMNKVRPPQALFDSEQAAASSNGYVFRRHHPLDQSSALYDVWNGEHYKDGFLFKEVNVQTFIDNQFTNKPTLEELRMFINEKSNAANDEDELPFVGKKNGKKKPINPEDDDDDNIEDDEDEEDPVPHMNATLSSMNADLAREIAKLTAEEDPTKVNPFVPGDIVRVIGGEMVNLIGRVISVNDVVKSARIRPYNNVLLSGEYDVELSLLVKYVEEGAHVKVMTGRYAGTTGRVVSVTSGVTGQDQLAIILTDGLNTEITCNVSILQVSDEVATGLGNLMGYELYDLVQLSENESAVVINVGTEKLKVINHLGNIKDVAPQELRGKLNAMSNRTKALDSNQNSLGVGDTVHVVSGNHAKLSGTIKHINKGTIWLHSNNHLRNSGVFVVKGRNCTLAGVNPNGGSNLLKNNFARNANSRFGNNSLSSNMSQQSTPTLGFVSRSPYSRNGDAGRGRDPNIGKTVRITKGKYKGKLGQVVEETTTHFSVELLSMFKKDMVKKTDAVVVGDKEGSFDRHRQFGGPTNVAPEAPEYSIAGATPYLTAETPLHVLGSETPKIFGNETPYLGAGGDDDNLSTQDSAWKVTDTDRAGIYSSSYNTSNYEDSSQMSFSRTATPAMTDFSGTPRATSAVTTPSYSNTNSMPPPSGVNNGSESEVPTLKNMVVVMKKGKYVGRMAVVQEIENGQIKLRLRDGQGRLQGDDILVSTDYFAAADPPKGSSVFAVKGPKKGRVGIVKSLAGKSELSIQFEDELEGNTEILRKSNVVWMNQFQGR